MCRIAILVQGALVDIVGATGNTGKLWWVVPRNVQEGHFFLIISPLTGSRRLEVSAHCCLSLVAVYNPFTIYFQKS